MKNRFVKGLMSVCAGVIFATSIIFPGCGKVVQEIDKNKTQIYVSVWNGGFGTDWISKTIKEFNEGNAKIEVVLSEPNKDVTSVIEARINAGIETNDIFFAPESSIQKMMHQDMLMDLSGVLESKPDGENGKTVYQKLKTPEVYEAAFKIEDKMYGLPYNESMAGFVYDHDLFLEKGFLFREYKGNAVLGFVEEDGYPLTVGKDGKAGTYDDGLPVDIQQWEELLMTIKSTGIYPFIWKTKDTTYLGYLQEAIWQQYDGTENYEITFDFDGVYTNPTTSTTTEIKQKNGYEIFNMEGLEKSVEFLERYCTDEVFYGNNSYVNEKCELSLDHTSAQNSFILGYKNTPDNVQSAMLFEGIWWENEARPLFSQLEEAGEEGRGYGERDYRFMILPSLEGQMGIDGKGHGTVFGDGEHGVIFARKQTDPVKERGIVDFLTYVHSDKILKRFLLECNGIRPFNFELSQEEFDQLTPFGQNAWTIYNDTENIAIGQNRVGRCVSPLYWASTPVVSVWKSKSYTSAYAALTTGNLSSAEYIGQLKELNNETTWRAMCESLTG